MTKKQENLLELYAEKKSAMKDIETELSELEPKVLKLLEDKGKDTLVEDYGTFSVVYRKKWMYTESLVQKEMEYTVIIKARKQEEQESGEAKAEETKGLSYRKYDPKKENKGTA